MKREHPDYSRVEIAGDFRRGCELVSDLALVAQGKPGCTGRGELRSQDYCQRQEAFWREPS